MNKHTITGQIAIKKNKVILCTATIAVLFVIYAIISHYVFLKRMDPRITSGEIGKALLVQMLKHPVMPLFSSFTLFILYILSIAMFSLIMLGNKRPKTEHLEDNHFMTPEELNNYSKECVEPFGKTKNDISKSFIYSEDIWLSYDNKKTNLNMNAIIAAGSGKGKTFKFVSPNLLYLNNCAVVTDPSGELLKRHAKDLENRGFDILVFDTKHPYRSLRYNPFYYIRSEKDAITMVDIFIENTEGKGDQHNEDFWIKAERLYFYAVTLFLYHTCEMKDRTFKSVLKLTKLAEIDENNPDIKSRLDLLFDELEERDPENTAVAYYKDYKIAAGKTLKSILVSLNARLTKMELDSMQYLTEKDELDLYSFADKKNVLFICIPTGDKSFNFIVSMLYSQLFLTMYEYAEDAAEFGYALKTKEDGIYKVFRANNKKESNKACARAKVYVKEIRKGLHIVKNKSKNYYEVRTVNNHVVGHRGTKAAATEFSKRLTESKIEKCRAACPIHVQLILDEFANIGAIPDFPEKLATIRKYSIGCSIIIQSKAQLMKNYKDDAENIIGNCDVKLFLGSSDKETIEWMQYMLGKREIITVSESFSANGAGSVNYSPHSVEMLTSYHIQQLDKEYCICIVTNYPPVYGRKYDTKNDPRFAECIKTEGQYIIKEKERDVMTNRDIPLIERERMIQAKSEKDANAEQKITDNTVNNFSVQETKRQKSDINSIQNRAKRNRADECRSYLNRFNGDAGDISDEEVIAIDFLNGIGLSPGAPDASIKESVESYIKLMIPPADNIIYNKTS